MTQSQALAGIKSNRRCELASMHQHAHASHTPSRKATNSYAHHTALVAVTWWLGVVTTRVPSWAYSDPNPKWGGSFVPGI